MTDTPDRTTPRPSVPDTAGHATPSQPDRDDAGDAPLETGDQLATAILTELAPLTFTEAADRRERAACFRLRHRAVVERRLAPDVSFPDGLEHDEFDQSAVQIVGRDGSRVIATCRLILPVPGRLLPTEQEFGVLRTGAVELGRVVVDPDYRGDGHSIFMGLTARTWLSMRARGFSAAIGATTERLIALFEALGFTVTRLGPPRIYWGEERHPFACEAKPAIREVERRWQAGEVDASPAARPDCGETDQ